MSTIFLSFADARMHRALTRVKQQASRMRVYDRIVCATEMELDEDFRACYRDVLQHDVPGYGFWCWKPQILRQVLRECSDGDIVQYTDAGCHLNFQGRQRLIEYFQLAASAPSGLLTFQSGLLTKHSPPPPIHPSYLPEYRWCKGDVFDFFGVRDEPSITHTETVIAGVFFVRKCEASLRFIDTWQAVYENDFSLIDNSPSKSPNFPGFVAPRNDQSIFSILCKLRNVARESHYEQWYPNDAGTGPNWQALMRYPIWAKRDRQLTSRGRELILRGREKLGRLVRALM